MPDTADHRADMYRLAVERRNAGRPVWEYTINLADVFHNDDMTFEQRRDAIVSRIRNSGWPSTGSYTLRQLVDELAEAQDTDEFDGPWDLIYDEADADRVWIQTF